jgi:hypothetical protein
LFLGTEFGPERELERIHQMDEFVTDQAGVKTEGNGQEQAGPEPVQETGFRKKNQDQDAGARQEHFAHGECRCAVPHYRAHDRISFVHTSIEQLQCHKGIEAAEDHCAYGEEEQPRMMPVEEQDLGIHIATVIVTTRPKETVEDSTPCKLPAIDVYSLF